MQRRHVVRVVLSGVVAVAGCLSLAWADDRSDAADAEEVAFQYVVEELNEQDLGGKPAISDTREPSRPVPPPLKPHQSYQVTSAASERIEAELENSTNVDFFNMPLRDSMEFIAQLHNIPILIDERGISDEALSADDPVTLEVSEIPLKSALGLMLEPSDLAFVIRHDVLLVTSQVRADELLETRVYNVSPLMNAGYDGRELIGAIAGAVQPDNWNGTKGKGSMNCLEGALIVYANQRAHREIGDLLGQLDRHASASSRPNPFGDVSVHGH